MPTPRTRLAFTAESALEAVEEIGYPGVLKPVVGLVGPAAGAASTTATRPRPSWSTRRRSASPQHAIFYVQEHVAKPGRDIRAFVVGDETICAIYRHSHALDHQHGARRRAPRTARSRRSSTRSAVRAARAVGGGVLAVDVLESEAGLLVSEVNDTMEFRNSIDATGVDIPGRIVDYVVAVARGDVLLVEAAP